MLTNKFLINLQQLFFSRNYATNDLLVTVSVKSDSRLLFAAKGHFSCKEMLRVCYE